MNEKTPHSRGDGGGSTIVVAAVFTVVVVLLAALLVGGVFIFYFAVPVSNVGRPTSPNSVTTAQNAVTTAQNEPVETQEDTDESVTEPPLTTDVDSTAKATDVAPEEEPDRTGVESIAEKLKPTIVSKADPVAKPADVTPPDDEAVEDTTMPPDDEMGEEDTIPPADETVGDSTPPAKKEKPEKPASENVQSLPQAFERVGINANGGDARGSVSFSGQKCESVIWAQPDEDEGESRVGYILDGKPATLRGTAGISDAADDAGTDGKKPSAVFRIYGDGNLLWESEPQTGFGAAQQFEVDVKGIEVLSLAAESGSSSEMSRFAWGDVELKPMSE